MLSIEAITIIAIILFVVIILCERTSNKFIPILLLSASALFLCANDSFLGSREIIGGANKRNAPYRNSRREIVFDDYPEFRPNLTPREMFEMGSFGGTYWRAIHSKITKKNYPATKHHKYSFLKGISENKMSRDWDDYDVNINKYKVKVGQSLEEWERKKWITKYDPYGWVQWYCNFYAGRRCPDDERQIKRWEGLAGPNGRFRKWLITEIKRKGSGGDKYKNYNISPAIRQTLQHWAYKLTKADYTGASHRV